MIVDMIDNSSYRTIWRIDTNLDEEFLRNVDAKRMVVDMMINKGYVPGDVMRHDVWWRSPDRDMHPHYYITGHEGVYFYVYMKRQGNLRDM